MSTRRKGGPSTPNMNPLFHIAAKTRIDAENVDKISLLVLICLDAANRGQAPNSLLNTLTEHLACAQSLWAGMGNRPMYDRAVKAWQLWCKALNREPDQMMRMTTTEYTAVRLCVSYYLRALPQLEVGRLVMAKTKAEEFLQSVMGTQPEKEAA